MARFFLKTAYLIAVVIIFSCGNAVSDKELVKAMYEAYQQKNWGLAVKLSIELSDRYPENEDSYVTRATAMLNMNEDPELIVNNLNNALRINADNHYARFLRYETVLKMDSCNLALMEMDTLINEVGDTPFLLTSKGIAAFRCKEFKIAEVYFKKRLDKAGEYSSLKFAYYYWIYSKYFGGNKDGAMWDCAFLPDRGFERDTLLMRRLSNDDLAWEECINFKSHKVNKNELAGFIEYDTE